MRSMLIAFFFLLGLTSAIQAKQPDIVIMLADDLTWHEIGCYGNEVVKTPHLDRLAKQGMRFTHCFTATAMCAPTRQQLYTGMFPIRNGAFPNHSKVKPGTKSLVHHFRSLGYRVGLSGKKHFGPPESFPFENLSQGGDLNLPKIREFIGRDAEQPYLLVVTSHSPHMPWKEGDAAAYDPKTVPLPPYLVDSPKTREAMTAYYAEITDFDREVGEVMKAVKNKGNEQQTIFLATSEQGGQFPHAKWTCYEAGLRTALIVRWPETIEPGSVSGAMVQYVDILPTLVEAAGAKPERFLTGHPDAFSSKETFDGRGFLAVLKGEATEHNEYVFGAHTTRGIIHGSISYPIRSIRSRDFKLIWNPNAEVAFQNIVTHGDDRVGYWAEWKELAKTNPHARQMVERYQHRPEWEFYDLRSDPHELTNLAEASEHASRIEEMKGKLNAWMRQQGDEGDLTERTAKLHKTQKANE